MDKLTSLENQTRRDSWQAVRDLVNTYLTKTGGRFSLREVQRELTAVSQIRDTGAGEIREALNELATMRDDESAPADDASMAFVESSANHQS